MIILDVELPSGFRFESWRSADVVSSYQYLIIDITLLQLCYMYGCYRSVEE